MLLGGFSLAAAGDAPAPDPRALVLACSGCHGGSAVPALDGMAPEHFIEAMQAFQAGSRPATVMSRIARAYDAAELAAMAAYFREHRP